MCLPNYRSLVVLVSQSYPIACDPKQVPVPHQVPLSMEFSRQEYWSGLPFPSLDYLLIAGIEPSLLLCRQILYHLGYREVPTIV